MNEMIRCDDGHEEVIYVSSECPACKIKKELIETREELEKLEKIKIKELKEVGDEVLKRLAS